MSHSPTIDLAMQLMACRSVTPIDDGCQDIMIARLQAIGFRIERLRFDDVDNFWAVHGDSGDILAFAGHTDVVPAGDEDQWQYPPYQPRVEQGLLCGRGAADMKGSLAAMVTATEAFISAHPNHPNRLAFLITSDEEGPAINGTVKVMEWLDGKDTIDYCLVGEASSSDNVGDVLRVGRRGSLSGRLKLIGKQGHVAYPHKVLSPILEVGPIISELNQTIWDEGNEHFDPTSFQISNIDSGTGATNVVPGHLNMLFNFRFSPESNQESLKKRFVQILEQSKCSFEIDWTLNAQPYLTKKTELLSIIQTALKKINGKEAKIDNGGGTSDGRWVSPSGSEVIELGPRNQTIHKIDEKISLTDITLLQEIYQQILVETNNQTS